MSRTVWLENRRQCHSLYIETPDADFGKFKDQHARSSSQSELAVETRQERRIMSTFAQLAQRYRELFHAQHLQSRYQQSQSEQLSGFLDRQMNFQSASLVESFVPSSGRGFKQESMPSNESANDAVVQVKCSTNPRRTNQPHLVPETAQVSKTVEQILSQAKHPAQVEWEQIWYHGISTAFQQIAHFFPAYQKVDTSTSVDQSISEPTLNISHLKKEDQAIFQQEKSNREGFVPRSEAEHTSRLQRAEAANDEQQRAALLLGLPTFPEYLERESQVEHTSLADPNQPHKRQLKREAKVTQKKRKRAGTRGQETEPSAFVDEGHICAPLIPGSAVQIHRGMTHEKPLNPEIPIPFGGAEHRPLVVGLKKPQSARSASTMASSSSEATAMSRDTSDHPKSTSAEAAASEQNPTEPAAQKPKKEKAPKQPKPQKAAPPTAPTSPAIIDLRVGHILRAIAHPNADSLYVSTIAMGDPEGAEHTQVDEETGKVVRTVCSGLNGLVPLEEMQNRKVIVVANLKPVNMRSIKSAAMVLAASPKQPEGADPHAADRVVELVSPPEGAEAGDKVYFEGWPYGEGKGPEKQLNPKKKQWEAIQPGFYTSDDLVVGFDASQCEEVEGSAKGKLIVEGKGACKVKTLKGAVVR